MTKECKLGTACNLFLRTSHGWEVRVWTLNLVMEVLCMMRRPGFALQISQEMDYHDCYSDRESYGIPMKGLCEDGRLNEATHLLYSMFWRISRKGRGQDIVIYTILLNALCDNNGQVREAVDILLKILKKVSKTPEQSLQDVGSKEFKSDDNQEIMFIKRLMNDSLVSRGIHVQPVMVQYLLSFQWK